MPAFEWPARKASVAVSLLLRKVKPDDTMMLRVGLGQEMNKITMKKGQEPAVPLENISAVESCCKMRR